MVLAVPWIAVPDALAAAGNLAGKVLLDCTNPLSADISSLVVAGSTSGGEQVAAMAPGARVVKIFNTTGSSNMLAPRYGETPITMFYAGDDDAAKETAAALSRDVGFEPVDAGGLSCRAASGTACTTLDQPRLPAENGSGLRPDPGSPARELSYGDDD